MPCAKGMTCPNRSGSTSTADGFASIDGELIAARTGEQRTDSVPAASRRRAGSEHPYLFAWKPPAPGWSRGHHRVDYAVSPRPSGPTPRLFRDWILPRPNSQIFLYSHAKHAPGANRKPAVAGIASTIA
jgi:hypothetical protein